ncbi:MAG: translation initiation factor IF-2 [Oligoflexia bacterium]|nr:translation initiation factor IF-2 [Oligoflexia bacterium]
MSEQQNVKVYELAKELGMPPLSLLDKLKGLNINVKNHMSDLSVADVTLARTSLNPAPAAKAKSTAAKKAAATATTGAAAPAAKKTVVSKTKKKAAEPVEAAPAESHAPKASTPVLRRRTNAEGQTETVTSAGTLVRPTGAVAESEHREGAAASPYGYEEAQGEAASSYYEEATETSAASAHEPQAYAGEAGEPSVAEAAQTEGQAEAAASAPESQELSPAAAAGATAPATTTQAASSAPATATGTAPVSKPARPPIAPFTRPVAPRRSILKIVEPIAPPPRPVIKPAAPATAKPVVGPRPAGDNKEGFRIIRMTKENIDQMVEEEAAKKRGGGKEAEIRPEDVRFADYRKKEMVFLPKKKRLPIGKEIKKTQITQKSAQKRVVEFEDTITLGDLANQLSVKATDVLRKVMAMGQMATINTSLDGDTATLIAQEYGYEARNTAFNEAAALAATTSTDKAEDTEPRPPIVTIMGHVDHGKTTLLDAIRETNVAGGEAGGITQHIGAYTVEKNGKLITFIDTPGHEAFSVMRARGANVTDIVILVVSADDGVMPQTREALSHAQAAKVPIIVAVNKIDKPGANPEKIKQALSELNLLAEEWGGDTMFIPVSALKKTNIDKLLDAILLQAEVLDLKANANAQASGTVLEARLEKGRGPVVSVLVSRGTLKVGDPIVSAQFSGKVRALTDDKGRTVKSATPGIAVEILGFEGLPNAGETFSVTTSEAAARDVAENRIDKARAKATTAHTKASLEDLFAKISSGSVKELEIVLKGDVFGSVEAVRDSLVKLSNEKVKVKVIYAAPGGITESDVLLASASEHAIIIGFNVRPETKARQLAEAEHVEIKTYTIIYELLDDVKKAMAGMLDKKKVEKFLGRAEVRQTFNVPKIGTIAGTSVIDGKMLRGANVRLLRDSRVIFEGKMSSLRRFKDDAKEVAQGFECGIGIENYNDLKPGDLIEAYQIEMVTPELDA